MFIECGGYHTVALNDNGDVYTWGRGDANQLGLPTSELFKDDLGLVALKPCKLSFFTENDIFIKSAACGEAHTLLLDTLGTVYSFGWAEDGQLGITDEKISSEFMSKEINIIDSLSEKEIIQISAGSNFSICLSQEGKVFVWGNTEHGQLGYETDQKIQKLPVLVEKIKDEKIISLCCGESHVLCITSDLKYFAWGLGKAGQFLNSDKSFSTGSDLVCHVPKQIHDVDNTQIFVVKSGKSATNLTANNEEIDNFANALAQKLIALQNFD